MAAYNTAAGRMDSMVSFNYFNRFGNVISKYMLNCGEGDTMASQIVTAVNKLIYKWYNDGDVYDNTANMEGWCNDLSSYANWLAEYCGLDCILDGIYDAVSDDDYEMLLKDLADTCLTEKYLARFADREKVGTIYDCEGNYKFEEKGE